MAKDRQRRRKRGSSSAGKPGKSRARDMGLDDPSIDESGITDPVPAPDPLKNASPDADMARFAETGADDDHERAPDLEEAALSARGTDPALAADRRPRKDRGRVLTFLGHSVDELRRVQWPDRKHVFQATAVVLGFVLVAGSWLGLMDAIWQPVINAIL